MKIRETGYPHPLKAMFGISKRQNIRLLGIGVLIAMAISYAGDPFLGKFTLVALSFTIGTLFNNFQFVRLVAKTWPFTEKVTDWEKVENLAKAKK